MQYCLDTNTCIDALKGNRPSLASRFARHTPADIGVAAMVRAELLLGVLKSRDSARTREVVEQFLAPYQVLAFDDRAADVYATVRADLERRGCPIGPNDLVIAATALSHNLVLVTHNTAEFSRVPGLRVEDWTVN